MTENIDTKEGETKYPKDDDIKVEWTAIHKIMIVVPFLAIWTLFYYLTDFKSPYAAKLLTIVGLSIDIIGVTIASLKTPFYGLFHDGGAIEVKRADVERKYFQSGMLLIAIGLLFQTLGSLIS